MRLAAPRRRTLALPALFALLAASACTDAPTTPATLAGRYPLGHVAGAPLPAPIYDGVVQDPGGDFHLRVEATSGWLELGADGRYDHGVDLAVTIDGAAQPATRWRDHGVFSIRGDSLAFDSEYVENVAFAGQVDGGRIHVDQDLAGEGRPARFTFSR
jgi:hypothetical protein